MGVGRSRIHDQVAVAVGGGGAVAVAVAGLTKRFFNHIQKDFLINVWGYRKFHIGLLLYTCTRTLGRETYCEPRLISLAMDMAP